MLGTGPREMAEIIEDSQLGTQVIPLTQIENKRGLIEVTSLQYLLSGIHHSDIHDKGSP